MHSGITLTLQFLSCYPRGSQYHGGEAKLVFVADESENKVQ